MNLIQNAESFRGTAPTKVNSRYSAGRLYTLAGIILFITTTGTILLTTFTRLSIELVLGTLIFGVSLIIQALVTFRSLNPGLAKVAAFAFTLVFLWIAPIIQLCVLKVHLVNTSVFDETLFLITNSICAFFSCVLSFGLFFFDRSHHGATLSSISAVQHDNRLSRFKLMNSLAIFIAALSLPIALVLHVTDSGFSPTGLFIRKFLLFVPTAVFLTYLAAYNPKAVHGKVGLIILVVLLACVLLTQNPMTEKRNGLGPVYLSVVYLGLSWLRRDKLKEFFLIIAAILFLFPLASIYTHMRGVGLDSLSLSDIRDVIVDHFLATHYDAWSNIYASVEIVQLQGVEYGKQLMGTLLFFVPSGVWPDKPLASGIVIGNYLKHAHSMWFTNLSAPLIAEAVLDFHIVGVAAYALILARLLVFIDGTAHATKSPVIRALAVYCSFFLIFLMRGSLMIAVAYGFGAIAAFVLVKFIVDGKTKG